MNERAYKYKPEDFSHIDFFQNDLSAFYTHLERYRGKKEKKAKWALLEQWEILFFNIKHAELCGSLEPVVAGEMRDYLEVMVNG